MRFVYTSLMSICLVGCGASESDGSRADGYVVESLPTPEAVQRETQLVGGATASPERAIEEAVVGRQLTSQGEIPVAERTDRFAVGEEIHLAVKVPEATPPAWVRVAWYGPNERLIRKDAQPVSEHTAYVSFSAAEVARNPGEYRAETWLDDEKTLEKIAEPRFAVAQK